LGKIGENSKKLDFFGVFRGNTGKIAKKQGQIGEK